MIYYENVKMWSVHTKTNEYDSKTAKYKPLKKPIVTERVHVNNENAYDLGELHDLVRYALQRDPYNKVHASFTVHEEF